MTDAKEDTAIEQYEGAGITPYGRRDEIRELVQRLKIMAPGGMQLLDNEALALAQYAYSMGLNPLVGECWFIKASDGRALGMVPGIKGYRRKAQEQANAKGSDYWLEFDEIVNPEERARLHIPDGALAVKARLYEMHKTQAYANSAKQLADAGAPWKEIRDIIGDKPYVEGISFIKANEMKQLEKGKLQMPHIQRSRKRAEAHALKQAFHLPFGVQGEAEDAPLLMDEYVVEGSFLEVSSDEDPAAAEEELFENGDQDDEQVDPEGYVSDEWLDWFRNPRLNVMPPDAHPKHIESLLKLSPFTFAEDKKSMQYGERRVTKPMLQVWLKEYRMLRDSDMKAPDAAAGATNSWEVKYGTSRKANS